MELYAVIEDLSEPGQLYVATNVDDIHNIKLEPVNACGEWTVCMDPNCSENSLSAIKILTIK